MASTMMYAPSFQFSRITEMLRASEMSAAVVVMYSSSKELRYSASDAAEDRGAPPVSAPSPAEVSLPVTHWMNSQAAPLFALFFDIDSAHDQAPVVPSASPFGSAA